MLDVGDTLSQFRLEGVDSDGQIRTYTRSELTETGYLVLCVYVYDYSPVCTDQVCDVSELECLTLSDDVTVAGISGDGPYSHQQFIEDHHIGYPLLCDTAEEVMEELGVIHEEKDGLRRVPKRSLFVVDADGTIRYKWIAEDNWDQWTSGPLAELTETVDRLRAES
jgi:peroxiredoxin